MSFTLFLDVTGLISGGIVSINSGDSDLFDISAGRAIFVDDFTDPDNIKIFVREWDDIIGVVITTPLQNVTFIAMDVSAAPLNGDNLTSANVIQRAETASTSEVRTSVQLGSATHIGGVPIQFVSQNPQVLKNPSYSVNDSMGALGPSLNAEGLIFTPNGANVFVDLSEGKTFRQDSNFRTDKKDSNITSLSAVVKKSFFPGFRDGSGGFSTDPFTDTVDTTVFDDGTVGGPKTIPDATPWVINRFYIFGNTGTTILQYGQETFKTFQDALRAVHVLSFEVGNLLKPANLRTHLIVKKGATDISDTLEAIFIGVIGLGNTGESREGTAPIPAIDEVAKGGFHIDENVTATTISVINTYVDIAGTGVAFSENNDFTFSSNELTYTGNPDIVALVVVGASMNRPGGASARDYRITLFKDTGSGFVEETGISGISSVTQVMRDLGFTGYVSLSQNDVLKLQVRNEITTDNIIVNDLTMTVAQI